MRSSADRPPTTMSSTVMHRFVVLFAILATAFEATADDIVVSVSGDGNFKSIQAAIDVAQPGALIRVAAGTYRENIAIDKPIELVGLPEILALQQQASS